MDKVGFHLEKQFKATVRAHNKPAIKANVQLGSGALQRARRLECKEGSHASASLASHCLIFNLLSSELIIFHYLNALKRPAAVGSLGILRAFHDTYCA